MVMKNCVIFSTTSSVSCRINLQLENIDYRVKDKFADARQQCLDTRVMFETLECVLALLVVHSHTRLHYLLVEELLLLQCRGLLSSS